MGKMGSLVDPRGEAIQILGRHRIALGGHLEIGMRSGNDLVDKTRFGVAGNDEPFTGIATLLDPLGGVQAELAFLFVRAVTTQTVRGEEGGGVVLIISGISREGNTRGQEG